MGCFDINCALSNVPIHGNDKIKKFYMTDDNYNRRNKLDFGNSFKLLSFPISGEYDDYGGIENVKEDFNSSFFEDIIYPCFEDVINPSRIRAKTTRETFEDEVMGGYQTLPNDWAIRPYMKSFVPTKYALDEKSCINEYKQVSHNGSEVYAVYIHENVWLYLLSIAHEAYKTMTMGSYYGMDIYKEFDLFRDIIDVFVSDSYLDMFSSIDPLINTKVKMEGNFFGKIFTPNLFRIQKDINLDSVFMKYGEKCTSSILLDFIINIYSFDDKFLYDNFTQLIRIYMVDPDMKEDLVNSVYDLFRFKLSMDFLSKDLRPVAITSGQYVQESQYEHIKIFNDMCKGICDHGIERMKE